jgi:ABC-type bacteriocin/lantibiotic exporter with double-glycine peptidase domain
MNFQLKRQWSAHEVVQTSNMDCGPAALASWMSSCGYSVSYPRLREACQTDVDGTSIDAMEELAERLGMPAEQVMVPVDALFNTALPNLPCIAVVLLPNRLTHFVVVWRQCLGWVQIMDPVQGRVWLRKAELERRLFEHETLVAAQDWLGYAQGDEYRAVLQSMAVQLRLPSSFVDDHFSALAGNNDWRSWAALEGAMRSAMQLGAQGFKLTAVQCQGLVQTLVDTPSQIPLHCWQVRPSDKSAEEIWLHGAVLLRCADPLDKPIDGAAPNLDSRAQAFASQMETTPQTQRNLMAWLTAEVSRPLLLLLFGCALLVGVLTFVEALVFRTLISTSAPASFGAALQLMLVVLSPIAIGIGLLAVCSSTARSLGRTLETRLRRRLLQHLPLISDSYFDSRLVNDLAERGHALALLAKLPLLLQRLLAVAVRIVGVLLGLAWLLPAQALWVLLAGLAALGLPLFLYRTVRDLDLRVRTHSSAVGQIYLDALRGSEAIAAHGATQPMAFESEARVLRWHTAFRNSGWAVLSLETLQLLIMALVAVVLVQAALAQSATLGAVLLVAYWALFLPIMARQLLLLLREYPNLRNVAMRVLEIVEAPTEVAQSTPDDETVFEDPAPLQHKQQQHRTNLNPEPTKKLGVALQWHGVSVHRAEQPVLHELNLSIAASEQVAIVGRSGSGKSSFLSLLLGWLTPQAGQLLVDSVIANPERIARLREQTVVIDSQMYLWNRPLFNNLVFGSQGYSSRDLEIAVNDSALQEDLERYAQGLAQPLGENGSRLSGGEGQRVRVARGLLRPAPKLVLLDEPFVGMGSQQRRHLREALRKRWPHSTLLFVVHDLQEVMDFSRVLVFGGGRILEDGEPKVLRLQADSAFAAMCAEEAQLQQRLFTESGWRSIRLHPARLSPDSAGGAV